MTKNDILYNLPVDGNKVIILQQGNIDNPTVVVSIDFFLSIFVDASLSKSEMLIADNGIGYRVYIEQWFNEGRIQA